MFKNTILVAAAAALFAASANAQTEQVFGTSYGWEDGVGTVLGTFGNIGSATNVATGETGGETVTPFGGSRMLELTEDPIGGTPQGFLAYIENLVDGDLIRVSFQAFDNTPGQGGAGEPSVRIWSHYANPGDVSSFRGSGGGNGEYSDGGGWNELTWTWSFVENSDPTRFPDRNAFIIEARLYTPDGDEFVGQPYYIDNVVIDVITTSPNAQITTPDGNITIVPEPSTIALIGLGVAALFFVIRRRR